MNEICFLFYLYNFKLFLLARRPAIVQIPQRAFVRELLS